MCLTSEFHLFLDQVHALSRLSQLTDILLQLGRKQGFRQLTIIDANRLSDGLTNALVFQSPPLASEEGGQLAFDPRLVWSRHNDEPNSYDEIRAAAGMNLDAWQRALQAPQPEPKGLVVPVHRQGALSWHVEFSGPTMPASRIALSFLHVGAVIVHDRMFRALEKSAESTGGPQLTPQEAACIHWAGLGKTNAEVGQIMGISARTARFHIDNVRHKYGAKTRTQAIVVALGRAFNASSTGSARRAAAGVARSA